MDYMMTLPAALESWLASAEREIRQAKQEAEIVQSRLRTAEEEAKRLRRWLAHIKAFPVPNEP